MKTFLVLLLICLDMIGIATALVAVVIALTGGSVDLILSLGCGTILFLIFVELDILALIVKRLFYPEGK